MAWSAPITFTSNTALTASSLNTYLRDNLLESEAAKSVTQGSYIVAQGANTIAERLPARAQVLTSQTTQTTTYVNLSTVGPAVTVTTGENALVIFGCEMFSDTSACRMSVDINGTPIDYTADDEWSLVAGIGGTNHLQASVAVWFDNLSPGLNTFTAKYRSVGDGSATATFLNRRIVVLPY